MGERWDDVHHAQAAERDAALAEAREEGRRAGLEEAAEAITDAWTGERGAYAAGMVDARDAVRRLAAGSGT